ncbi:MAG: flippase [Chloroflexi bacterium]|nr:flippase [Chloroflexota bacterium]
MAETSTRMQRASRDTQILVNNGMILLSRRLLLWVFSGVLVLFLPKYLGDQGLGQLAFAQSVAGLFTTFLALGLSEFLIKEFARNNALIRSHLTSAIGLRVIMSLAVVGAVLVLARLTDFSTDATNIIFLATGAAIALSFMRLMVAVLHGLEEMRFPAVSEVISRFLVVAIGVPILVQGMGVVAYGGVLVGAAIVNFGINAAYVRRRFPVGMSLNVKKIKFLLVGGMPFLFMGFLLDIYNQTDTIVLRIFTDEAVVGWYAAANNIYKTIDMLPLALTAAILPTLSRVYAQGADASVAIAKKSIAIGALGIVPLSIGISLFSNEIITTLPYPDSFQHTVPLLTILALTIPITAFLVILGTIAVAVDRQKAWAIALFATVLMNVVLNIFAAPYFQENYGNGGIGVALTTLATEIFMVAYGVFLMPKGVIDRAMGVTLIKVAISAGAMAAVVLMVRAAGLGPVPTVLLGGLTYVAVALATKAVPLNDLRYVLDVVRRKLKSDSSDEAAGGVER